MSKKRPTVSVVIPTFKQTHLVRTAVKSLFTQDLPHAGGTGGFSEGVGKSTARAGISLALSFCCSQEYK